MALLLLHPLPSDYCYRSCPSQASETVAALLHLPLGLDAYSLGPDEAPASVIPAAYAVGLPRSPSAAGIVRLALARDDRTSVVPEALHHHRTEASEVLGDSS